VAIVVAKRYARALVDVVAKTGEYQQVLRELEDFATAYRESADLREVLRSPAVTLEVKVRLLQAILERLGASQVTTNFLRVLLDHYRIALLEEVITAYQRLAHDRLGIVEVKIASAGELSAAEREAGRDGVRAGARVAGRGRGADPEHRVRRFGPRTFAPDQGTTIGALLRSAKLSDMTPSPPAPLLPPCGTGRGGKRVEFMPSPLWGRGRSSRRAGRDRVRGLMCRPIVQDLIGCAVRMARFCTRGGSVAAPHPVAAG
jgi:ATP synthase F1 delta subunit